MRALRNRGWRVNGLLARPRLIGLALALAIFAVDQWIKAWVIGIGLREVQVIELISFFRLTWVENYGVSLGLLTANSMEMRWGLIVLPLGIAGVVLVWLLREKQWWDIAPLALVLGGAMGNIRDRVNYGFVVDYADLHFGDFRPFLVFNLADAAITIGVLIILARSFLSREKRGDEDAGAKPSEI
mgnify:FL=1